MISITVLIIYVIYTLIQGARQTDSSTAADSGPDWLDQQENADSFDSVPVMG